MPTYEYRCKSCGHEFEEFQSMSSEPLVMCPKCANPSLKRLMSSGVGLVFKGSGFYLTDYKKSSASLSPNSSKTESMPVSKTETKSEANSSKDTTASTEKQ
jgi:putative FmdB family regulatory protein